MLVTIYIFTGGIYGDEHMDTTMSNVVKGYPDELAVEAIDDKTLAVTLNNAVAYWNELMAFPCYFFVHEATVASESWATDPSTYICNGPYKMIGWEHDAMITLTKNENYHDADSVVMNELKVFLSMIRTTC